MIRFGILGAGFIGAVHAANIALNPRTRLVGIFDIRPEKARALAGKFGARADSTSETILQGDDIDAVLICSSTPTHASYMRAAVEHGKAVLCEKPISLNLNEAEEVSEFVDESTAPVMVGFNRRFDPDYCAVQREVEKGTIGKPEIVQITHRGPQVPSLEYLKSSGGQMRDSGVHFFDLLRWITGDDPVEIFVFGSCMVNPAIAEFGDTDTSIISLRFSSGALGQINFSRRTTYGYDDRIEVFGSLGMIESQRQKNGNIALFQGDKIINNGLYPGWFERISDTYALELDAFVDALDAGVPPSPSLDDGLRAQAIAEAATQSLNTGQSVSIRY